MKNLFHLRWFAMNIMLSGNSVAPFKDISTTAIGHRNFSGRQLQEGTLLEVEQKFHFEKASDLEKKLQKLGFDSQGAVTFVDWYFDNDANCLSTKDHWLRYREKSGQGQWELKVGRGHHSATVYEEIEGDGACLEAIKCIKESGSHDRDRKGFASLEATFDGFQIPSFPPSIGDAATLVGLAPFCRLETQRSSWKVLDRDHEYFGLTVDLDSTNTGHTVGEVEILCNETQVATGKARVQHLISELCGTVEGSSGDAIGKLEHYLLNYRPEHYELCIQNGVLRR